MPNYDAKNSVWSAFAGYQEPDPTFWNWFFSGWTKKVSDPNMPPVATAPLTPTQPIDVPSHLKRLKDGLGNRGAKYLAKSGYGYPSTYLLAATKPEMTGKAFGTIAGKGLSQTVTDKWDVAVDSTYSIRKTSNKDASTSTGYRSICDPSYMMITGVLSIPPGATEKTFILNVTSTEYSKTLAERVPTRPDAVTAPMEGQVSPRFGTSWE